MQVLVIAQHDNQSLNPSTLNCLAAAQQISDDITVLVLGYQDQAIFEQVRAYKVVKKIIYADASSYERFLPENLVAQVVDLASDFTHIIAPANSYGKSFLARAAGILNVGQISDVVAIHREDIFERPIYAGKAFTVVQSLDSIKLLTIRCAAFEPVIEKWDKYNPDHKESMAGVVTITKAFENNHTRFEKIEMVPSDFPDLATATKVVSVGRGIQGKDNLRMIYRLAEVMGAAVGATRAVVDAGYIGNDHQVGQTGKMISPNLYIAIGISGAVQHLAGMNESKVIVAINKDEEAPIMEIADYYIVDNLFRVVPEFIRLLEAEQDTQ